MLALRKARPDFGADLVEIGAPAPPGPGEVTISVAAAGICGSDVHAFEWTPSYGFMAERMPVTLGHEFAGIVSAMGAGVEEPRLGDRVTCWPTVGCGACPACRDGRPQHCPDREIVGLHVDGAFADQVVVPAANCRRVPDGLPLDVAALAEPLAIAVNAVDVAEIRAGERVAVLGPGPIGLCVAFVARQRGADVLLAGFDDAARLSLAGDLGIAHRADLATESLDAAVRRAFAGEADRVIEATGVARSVTDGLAVLRPGGVLVVAGIHVDPLELDLTAFVRSKKQLRAAHDTTVRAFDEGLALLAAHAGALACLITHRRPLDGAMEALDLARARGAAKVLLIPGAIDGVTGAAA